MNSLMGLHAAIVSILCKDQTEIAAPRICAAVSCAAPCDGAAVTIMTSDSQQKSLYASDRLIAQFQRAQLNLGEGPSLHAFSTTRPVLLPDMTDASVSSRWPILHSEAARLPLGGVYCFPLRGGVIPLGVVTMHCHAPRVLTPSELEWIRAALDLMTQVLLATGSPAAEPSPLGRWVAAAQPLRWQLEVATGMLTVQLGVPLETAFARLRAHAFAQGQDIAQVAEDIVHNRLQLEVDPA